ncbi:hypothetical protein P7K49_004405, partial [Saguinus oedipus]
MAPGHSHQHPALIRLPSAKPCTAQNMGTKRDVPGQDRSEDVEFPVPTAPASPAAFVTQMSRALSG